MYIFVQICQINKKGPKVAKKLEGRTLAMSDIYVLINKMYIVCLRHIF